MEPLIDLKEIGEAKGRKNQYAEIVSKMLSEKEPIQKISRYTGLTTEENLQLFEEEKFKIPLTDIIIKESKQEVVAKMMIEDEPIEKIYKYTKLTEKEIEPIISLIRKEGKEKINKVLGKSVVSTFLGDELNKAGRIEVVIEMLLVDEPIDKISKHTLIVKDEVKQIKDSIEDGRRSALTEVISKMLDEAEPIEKICKYIKLTIDEVEELKGKLNKQKHKN